MTFYFRGIVVLQDWREIDRLMRLANHERVTAEDITQPIYLEIGARTGGSLLYAAEVLGPDWKYIIVDWPTADPRRQEFEGTLNKTIETVNREGRHTKFVRGDSHASATWKKVRHILDGCKVSLLLIDGDHSFEGVRRDFEDYGRFVREGGLIALCDIRGNAAHHDRVDGKKKVGTPDVIKYWGILRQSYPPPKSFEIVFPHSGYGIGVVVK